MWVVFHDREVIFIGDAVTVEAPPFLGESNIPAWLEILDDLRAPYLRTYRLIASRDGQVSRENINSMARFLRKVQLRVEKLEGVEESEAGFDKIASGLLMICVGILLITGWFSLLGGLLIAALGYEWLFIVNGLSCL